MPVALFSASLVELPVFLDLWAQITPEPELQTEALLYWLSWGTYHLNTSQGPIPVVDVAMQTAHPQWFSNQNSVLSFAQDLGEAAANLLAPLPPLLAFWVESGQWRTWIDTLWTRWHAAGQTASAGQQAMAKLLLNTDWMIHASWVEFAYTNDGQGMTHTLGFQRISGAVDVTWQPPESSESLQYWLPHHGRLSLPEGQFFREIDTFRQDLWMQMNQRLLALTVQGHLPFDQVALGKRFLCEALGPVQPAPSIRAEAVLPAVRRLETHFGLKVKDCLPKTNDG